jgi:EmrB/QacA subfamily drug resistance transporter
MIEPDPKRWITLGILLLSLLIIVVDNTVLTVAIPTILRELHTTIPAMQWVLTGYSLTFATLLIIGGRLGDLYGARRLFIVGATLFGIGSLIASMSQNVGQLIVGESIIEGIGAAMMMPATLGIIANTFTGRERATAFAGWGAVAGAAVAFGPILGGYLTTYHSWRWAFRINVVVTPIAILGAWLLVRRDAPKAGAEKLDVGGSVLVAVGTFSLVFAISQAGTYGWWTPLAGSPSWWPATRPVSAVPFVFVVAIVALVAFVRLQLAKERTGGSPLFELGQLRYKTFRYGLICSFVIATGQLGMLFVLPVFLQDGKHLSAVQNGLWLVPMGVAILVGAQVSGRLTAVMGTTTLVRFGLVLDATGLVLMGLIVRPGVGFLPIVGALSLFGIGVGFASAQLTNVILFEILPEKTGVASGANSTVRQAGSALGVAMVGSLLTSQTIRHATTEVARAAIPSDLKARTLAQVRTGGIDVGAHAPRALQHAIESAVAAAARPSLLLASGIVVVGAVLSFLIPPVDQRVVEPEPYDAFEPLDTHTVQH